MDWPWCVAGPEWAVMGPDAFIVKSALFGSLLLIWGRQTISLRVEGELTFGLSVAREAVIRGNKPYSDSALRPGFLLPRRLCLLLVENHCCKGGGGACAHSLVCSCVSLTRM